MKQTALVWLLFNRNPTFPWIPSRLLIEQNWSEQRFHILTREHFYHVGSTEDLRHPMIEALITNFPAHAAQAAAVETEQMAFFERPLSEFLASRPSAAH